MAHERTGFGANFGAARNVAPASGLSTDLGFTPQTERVPLAGIRWAKPGRDAATLQELFGLLGDRRRSIGVISLDMSGGE